MKKNIWIVILCALCVGLFACDDESAEEVEAQGSAGDIDSPDGIRNAYAALIEEAMAESGTPGVGVAIIQGNEIVMAEGFGYRDVEQGLPATADTLFHIGSTNKSMTAMAIAALVDDGGIEWDMPVSDIYPDFELGDSTDVVTLRHLLSMQSGIPDWAEDDFDVDNGSAEDLFAYVADIELLGKPEDEFSYSNISASLGGYVGGFAFVENNSLADRGLYDNYANLLKKRVLDPIGMTNAVVRYSDAQRNPNYGKSYVLDGDEAVEAESEDYDGDPLAPSGALKASAAEMALYISTQLNRGVAPNGNRVISEENMVEMWKPYLENYAMGWEISTVEGVEVISHEGSFDNYLSVIGFVPELELGFVILTNSADAGEDLIVDGPEFLINFQLDES